MLLVVDIGNTNIVLGVYRGETLQATWRVATGPERTADEYHILLASLFAARQIDPGDIRAAAIACVVPPLVSRIRMVMTGYIGVEPLFIEPGIRTGVAVVSELPQEVGADRIVNAAAAYHRVGGAAVVVDFGTATTFDAISPRGEYLGGAIAPGIEIGAEALFRRAAKLPRVEVRRTERVIGRNTVQSLQSGLFHGYVGLVRWMVARMKEELPEPVRVLATGGHCDLLCDDLGDCIDEVVPFLTLEGLRLIYARNRS